MTNIRIPKGWERPESEVTPQSVWRERRQLVKAMGLGAISGLGAGSSACGLSVEGYAPGEVHVVSGLGEVLPAPRNPRYVVNERPLTEPVYPTTYNNYYEFTTVKDAVHLLTGGFDVEPWTIEIGGLCNNPRTVSFDELLSRFPLEERVYRFRCVERWAMTVPWTGFPLADLIAWADPMSSARFVAMTTVSRPSQQPGLEDHPRFPWPYFEGLRLDEAMNELALMVVGLYGEPLPVQNGAPVRLITPWKYGYKSTKAIVRIDFLAEQPPTFWNTLNSREYGFYSNVDPGKPHPRWSQEFEWLIPDRETIPTQLYNGYGEFVASMYDGTEH